MSPPQLPPELISLIIHHLYLLLLPPAVAAPNADPFLTLLPPSPKSSATPLPAWTTPSRVAYPLPPPRPPPLNFAPPPITIARHALLPLCLVNKVWNDEATKCLWRSVGFGMPKGFEGLLRTVGEYEGTIEVTPDAQLSLARLKLGRPIPMSAIDPDAATNSTATANVNMNANANGASVTTSSSSSVVLKRVDPPTLHLVSSHSPLLYTHTISFSRFRTAGLRRSVSQGSQERFVTPERLLRLLVGSRWGVDRLLRPGDAAEDKVDEEGVVRGRLEGVGFTEFMDSAITLPVLEELLLRGGYLATYSLPPTPPPAIHVHPTLSRPPSPPIARGRERVLQAFRAARDLQSSRSPTRVVEVDEDDSAAEIESEDEDEDEVAMQDDELELPERVQSFPPRVPMLRRSSGVTFQDPPAVRQRRTSGSAFAQRAGRGPGRRREEHSSSDDEGEERGRGRSTLAARTPFAARSSSVPAEVFLRQSSAGGGRSSSVPAIGKDEPAAPREMETRLEGSLAVRPIRALDLCGCVSATFVAAVGEMIERYSLSGHAVDQDSGRQLVRVQFPHLRRLGVAASLLPSAHLTSLITSFPFLTHLDLTSTLTSPSLLYHLAVFGQSGPGGRSMRLTALSLARCRLMTGAALVGFFCGDCPPFTSIPSSSPDDPSPAGSWGSGEVVSQLTDLSLYGDSTYPSSLTQPELRLLLTTSPAFHPSKSQLRSLDLSSSPLDDPFLLAHFPPLPHLIELGLANCRLITFRGVATLLEDRAPGVEVLDLSGSCLFLAGPAAATLGRRVGTGVNIPMMEFHGMLLARVASVDKSGEDEHEEADKVARRKTNLRVVELGQKTLEAVQGGAGDWKVVWGKGRRGWYVDIGVGTISNPAGVPHPRPRTLRHLPRNSPSRVALQKLVDSHGIVSGETGWHPRKMEVLNGNGLMGREDGLYGFHAFQI